MEMYVSSETTFLSMKLQPEICPQLRTGSSAENRCRIDTKTATILYMIDGKVMSFYNTTLKQNTLLLLYTKLLVE